jgi:DNA helicase HerA-like ATPase
LKALFFRHVFDRTDMTRPYFYIADEAHRFLQAEGEAAEAGVIERCRAYRCSVMLATQTISSIDHAFGGIQSGYASRQTLLGNIGSKFFFRTTEPTTTAYIKTLLPSSALGLGHIVDARPLAALRPGEGYYVFADGESGRKQGLIYQSPAA